MALGLWQAGFLLAYLGVTGGALGDDELGRGGGLVRVVAETAGPQRSVHHFAGDRAFHLLVALDGLGPVVASRTRWSVEGLQITPAAERERVTARAAGTLDGRWEHLDAIVTFGARLGAEALHVSLATVALGA
jgi:hypothetical protein